MTMQNAMEQARDAGQQAAELTGSDLSGRAAVRFYLLAPLAGLPRPKGVKAAEHDAALDKLAEKLAHMTPQALRGVAELVLRQSGRAAGARAPVWPPVPQIVAWAYALQPPLWSASDYVRSVMASELGPRAAREGWLVELYQRIKSRFPPPPTRAEQDRLRGDATANAARLARIEERLDQGRVVDPDDAHWRDRRSADLAQALTLLPVLVERDTA